MTGTQIIEVDISSLSPLLLAQSDTASEPSTLGIESFISAISESLGGSVPNIIGAIAFLVVGWIVALIASGIVRGILSKTDIDNKIAAWITGAKEEKGPPVEKWAGDIAYWLVILFTLVGVLNSLQLDAVSEPLNEFLGQVTGFLPKLGGAAILIGVAWLLATVAQLVLSRALGTLRLDERLNQQMGEEAAPESQFHLSETLGNAVYWFIFLLFLPSILGTLELEGTLQPVQALLDQTLSILPKILAAVLIGAVGWLIAQIVRRVVRSFLAATGCDRLGEKFGLSASAGRQSLSWIIATIVYISILIPVAISALNALQIEAISAPAVAMLQDVLSILPKIFAASVVLIVAYVIGQYVSELVTSILTGVGFNNVFQWLGLSSRPATPASPETKKDPSSDGTRTPSQLVGVIAQVGIILIATLTAVDILKIEALTTVVKVILAIASQVLIGVVVFAIGLYLANAAFYFISTSGTRQSKILGQTARIAIITLVSAMALQQMGIAPNIVNLAFGLLVGGIAVAIALAFGIGGRQIAAQQLQEWLDALKKE